MNVRLNFYTEPATGANARLYKFLGRCRQYPNLVYYSRTTRDAALSGIKRLVKKNLNSTSPQVAGIALQKSSNLKQKTSYVSFVIDRSGSMRSIMNSVINALNENIEALRTQSRMTGIKTYVSVYVFDDSIDRLVNTLDIEQVGKFNGSQIYARGSTALFDATGRAIEDMKGGKLFLDEDESYLLMVLTDGEENCSKVFPREAYGRGSARLQHLMNEVQKTDRWTLTFLVPRGSESVLINFGIPAGNISSWEATAQGVQQYSQQVTQGLNSYYSMRTAGQTSSKTFYTDLSKVSASTVRKALEDISSEVKVLTVDKEQDIREFVESKTRQPLRLGTAFYELTKDEKKVQGYKKILVMEKNKKAVYGGDDARAVLGLPTTDVRIKPGNHSNFDIFVQSTSTNRKLVRGTKVVVWPRAAQ